MNIEMPNSQHHDQVRFTPEMQDTSTKYDSHQQNQ